MWVDLHSHVLPGLDDGVRTLPEALGLIAALGQLGFSTVCATPHQRANLYLPARESIDAAYTLVKHALPTGSSELYLGAENFWDEVLAERLPANTQPTYTGGKAFLFEIPVVMWPPRLTETLFEVRMRGTLPVMAHPERYAPLWNQPERIAELARSAALVVDLAALEGAHGQNEKRAARFLVDEGFAHAAASDSHSLEDVGLAAAGIGYIKKRHGQARVDQLLGEGPRAILSGALPD